MRVPFDKISDNARLWIYQAERKLNTKELEAIEEKLTSFTQDWEAHGSPLQATHKIFHNQFVVVAVDEMVNKASGCSIDSSVHMMQEVAAVLNVDFFDRTKIAFIFNDEVYIESLSNLKSKVEEGLITKDTLTFNNLVKNKQELESSWLVPAKETWMSRYFN